MQNDYFEGGRWELYHAKEAAIQAEKILNDFREKKQCIIHIQHISNTETAAFFLPDTDGVKIHSLVNPHIGEYIIVKHRPNSFYQTDLEKVLKKHKITNLTICGMMSHMCVDTTVRAAKDLGYHITLIQDACTTKDMVVDDEVIPATTVHNVFMGALKQSFATLMTADEFLGMRHSLDN